MKLTRAWLSVTWESQSPRLDSAQRRRKSKGLEDFGHDLRARVLLRIIAGRALRASESEVQRKLVERGPRVPLVLGAIDGAGVVPG